MEQSPVHLALDVGNSRTKVALYQGNARAVRWATLNNGDTAALERWLAGVRPQHAVVGSVAQDHPAMDRYLATLCPVLEVFGDTGSPLRSAYATSITLGADRLANAVGGSALFMGRPVLAVDAGTCITYDLVEANGTYRGGAITPGMHLRAKAMHAYSARLPLVEPESQPPALGTDTRSSLVAGIHHGILGEVDGFIRNYAHDRPTLAVVLTGGDAPWIAAGLKNGIFAHPLLTLDGLHAILLHNITLHRATDGAVTHGRSGPGTTG